MIYRRTNSVKKFQRVDKKLHKMPLHIANGITDIINPLENIRELEKVTVNFTYNMYSPMKLQMVFDMAYSTMV